MPSPKERIQEIDVMLSHGMILEWKKRRELVREKRRLIAYIKTLTGILNENPYLDASVGCGYQNFQDFACGRQFYVDKTHFIAEWLKSIAKVTLITRPRRF